QQPRRRGMLCGTKTDPSIWRPRRWALLILALVFPGKLGATPPAVLFPSYTYPDPPGVIVKNDFAQLGVEVQAMEGRAAGRSVLASRPAASTSNSRMFWVVTNCNDVTCSAGTGTVECLTRVNDAGSAWDVGPCETAAGTAAFSALTGGTNTAAAMVVGTRAPMPPSGSGTGHANQLAGFSVGGSGGGATAVLRADGHWHE